MLINPESCDELVSVVRDLKSKGTPYIIIGNGSNLLVSDEGIRCVVIQIGDELSNIKLCNTENQNDSEESIFIAEAGVKLSKLAGYALKNELTGLEFAAGIPGTLGGAIFMNAGAYDGEMSFAVESTEYYDISQDKICTLNNTEHQFEYRKSIFQKNNGIILKSKLKLKKATYDEIKAKMDDFAERRKSKQPLEYASAGSTFKRPEGHFAGKLIQDAGLRGHKIGGAQVSEKHCGFVINTGDATATDILKLIDYVKTTVYNKFKVQLEEEVRKL